MTNNSIKEAISRLWQNVLSQDDANLTEAKSYADSVAADVKNELLNGAGDAYDTLKELGELITDNADAIDALENVATNKADKEHTHNYAGAATPGGAAIKSDKLTTPRNIDISGRVSGSATFDGSGDINISTIDTQHISDYAYTKEKNTLTGKSGIAEDVSSARHDLDITLTGLSTQASTPSIEAPVEVINYENPTIRIFKKNLLKYPYTSETGTAGGVTVTANSDGSLTLNGTVDSSKLGNAFTLHLDDTNPLITLRAGVAYKIRLLDENGNVFSNQFSTRVADGNSYNPLFTNHASSYTPTIDKPIYRIFLYALTKAAGTTYENKVVYPILEVANDSTGYDQYSEQSVTIPLTLAGHNDYKDELVINKSTRKVKYIQRYYKYEFTGNENWYIKSSSTVSKTTTLGSFTPSSLNPVLGTANEIEKYQLCNIVPATMNYNTDVVGVYATTPSADKPNTPIFARIPTVNATSADFNAVFKQGAYLWCALKTPIETDYTNTEWGQKLLSLASEGTILTFDCDADTTITYNKLELYYKLGTMVAIDDTNKGSISINGRLGGWDQDTSAYFNFMLLNRGRGVDYSTISSSVLAMGSVDKALMRNDIVVYKQPDTSANVYLKTYGYWSVDFNWNAYQHTVEYVREPVTPTGTLIWSLSTASKVIIDHKGNVSAASFKGDIEGNAASADTVEWNGVKNKPDFYDPKAIKSLDRNGLKITSTHFDGTTEEEFSLPAETPLQVTTSTAEEITQLNPGDTFYAVEEVITEGEHNIAVGEKQYKLPQYSSGQYYVDDTVIQLTPGQQITYMEEFEVDGDLISGGLKKVKLPTETTLSRQETGDGNAVTSVSVSGHKITVNKDRTFVDKQTPPWDALFVYSTKDYLKHVDSQGFVKYYPVIQVNADAPTEFTIPLRNGNGVIRVKDPLGDSDAATKKYVDGKPGVKTKGMTYTDASGNTCTCGDGEVFNSYGKRIIIDSAGHPNTGNLASGDCSHAEGSRTTASGSASHAEGNSTTSSGDYSHAEGRGTTAYGSCSHAEGDSTEASGDASHAEGWGTTADGNCSHAEGYSTSTTGNCSHAEGYHTAALAYQHAQGHYNSINNATAGSGEGTGTGTAFVIGNGTPFSASNAFRVNYSGTPYAKSALTTTGCDYAEYFEWEDMNLNSEDRRGYFVTLNEDKIKLAQPGDYILGVTSGQPSIIGNGDEDWLGRYVFDEFGAFIYEDFEYEVEVPEEIQEEVINEETGESTIVTKTIMKTVTKTGKRYKENPDYDPTIPYIQREDRPEWSAVGMLGVLSVRDDGTCRVNGYCNVAEGGIATASETGYRVIKRVNDNIVKVIVK